MTKVDRQTKEEKSIREGIMDPSNHLAYEIDKRLLGENFAAPTFDIGDIFLVRIAIQESAGLPIQLEIVDSQTGQAIKVLMTEIVPKPKERAGGTAYVRGWMVEPGTYPAEVTIQLSVGNLVKKLSLARQH